MSNVDCRIKEFFLFYLLKIAERSDIHNSSFDIHHSSLPEVSYERFGFGANIGHGLIVGWVEHPDIFCWVSCLNPTYVPAIFVLSAKPNKMAEDKTVSHFPVSVTFEPRTLNPEP
jgi:hypothetical protein